MPTELTTRNVFPPEALAMIADRLDEIAAGIRAGSIHPSQFDGDREWADVTPNHLAESKSVCVRETLTLTFAEV